MSFKDVNVLLYETIFVCFKEKISSGSVLFNAMFETEYNILP